MIDLKMLQNIIDNVKCRDFTFRVEERDGGFLVQVQAWRPDASQPNKTTNNLSLQKGRKWYVSKHSCRTELMSTLLAAVVRFETHEILESFTWCGQRIYSPHLSIDYLHQLAEEGREEYREGES